MPTSIAFDPPEPEELAALMGAAGWGAPDPEILARSIGSYTATACARAPAGELIGYASVFSDGVLTTMFGEFVVHPLHRRQGIGRAIMAAVERRFPGAPVYVKALGASREFYAALGFRVAGVPMSPMFKRPPF